MLGRRAFLGAAAGLAAFPASGRAAASDRVRIAVIGLRSRGLDHLKMFGAEPNADVVAVCDVDDAMLDKAVASASSVGGKAPRTEKDFRRILDDKSIDAVTIAAPDHWHALMTIRACQAGKDVYVEKPASHNVVEGRRMVEAARKYQRVVQVGMQRRSSTRIAELIQMVQDGKIGKVGMARAWIHQVRPSIGHGKPGPVPAGVDYAMWQGPAPDRPFYPNRFHYNWHWFWNWGTGELGNNGIHAVDVARWGLGVDAPIAVTSGGGKYVFDDDQEVPDTQVTTWEFPGACIVWEHRMWSKHPDEGVGFGTAFYGDKGTIVIGAKNWLIEDTVGPKGEPEPKSSGPHHFSMDSADFDGQRLHVRNFLESVKNRNKPNADIEIGHLSTRLCHLGNIAFRAGKKLTFDAARESFRDAEVNALLSREYSNRFAMPSQV